MKFEENFSKYPKIKKEEAEEKRKLMKKFDEHETYLKDKAKVRNELESTLYAIKDSYEQEVMKKFSKEQELEKLKELVSKEIDWMDENAWTATKEDFESHFKLLYAVYEPIYNRTTEYQDREKSYNATMGLLSNVYLKTEDLNKTHEWLGEKIQDQLAKINKTVA